MGIDDEIRAKIKAFEDKLRAKENELRSRINSPPKVVKYYATSYVTGDGSSYYPQTTYLDKNGIMRFNDIIGIHNSTMTINGTMINRSNW